MAEEEEWQLCLKWLQSCRVLPREFAGRDLSDFAQCLRDGVVLCQLITTLIPNIEPKDYSIRPQMSQFLCLKNIRWFLNACRDHMRVRTADLFEPYDLFELQDFKKVMNCLSKLSITDVAVRQGYQGFQPQEEDIYRNLEELTLSDMPDEDIYGPVAVEDEGDQIYEDLCSFKPRSRPSMVEKGVDKTKADFCIEEILETEKNYVHALQMITEKFIRHLELNFLSPELVDTIFINIEDIYKIHQEVYADLKKATSPQDIAKVFIKAQKRLVIYAEYCARLPQAQNKVDEMMKKNDVVKHAIADSEHQANEGKFKLRDLLVVPMQRIMKYGLLLQELRKNLDKEKQYSKSTAMMKEIEKAVAMMQDLAYYVNEVKRDRESLETIRMIEESIEDLSMPSGTKLDDYGHLLKDGELKVKFHDDNRELRRYIFLFDKVILMCKSRGETYSYKNALVLHDYKLEDVPGGPIKVLAWRHSFMLVKKENKTAITFFAKNEEMKRKWIDSICLAIENFDPPSSKENGFEFLMHTFIQATECDACHKLLAGCFYQGYLCSKTKKKVHKHCIDRAVKQVRPGTLSPRAASHRRHKYITKHAYHGLPPHPQDKTTLSFNIGELIDIDNMDDRDWYYGSKNGSEGYFPASYVEKARGSMVASARTPSISGRSFTVGRASVTSVNSVTSPIGPDYVNTCNANLSTYPWYIGTYNKKEASAKLADAEDGVFLVRESKDNPGTHAIGIAYGQSAKHIKITKTKDVYSIADFKGFSSIPDLIKYYQTHTLQDSFPELTTSLRIPFNSRGLGKRASISHANSFEFPPPHEGRRPSSRKSMPTIIGKAKVTFDYSSKETNQITLVAGEMVAIISKAGGDRGWWKGAVIKNGQLDRIGYFPLAYVEECEDDASGFL